MAIRGNDLSGPGRYALRETIYLDKTRKRVVPAGSREASFILGGAGTEIPLAQAEALGLVKMTKPMAEAELSEIEPGEITAGPATTGPVPSRVAGGDVAAPEPKAPPVVINKEEPQPERVGSAALDAGEAKAEAQPAEPKKPAK